VVEVDIRKFFDNVSHYWLQRCLEERISDPNVLLLLRRFLRSGVMQDGVVTGSDVGTPQGGVVSPLLANIYLHYILDLWFERVFRKSRPRAMALVRYCDDFVATFESRKDAEAFLSALKERLAKFGLEMAEEKTRLLAFGLSPAARDASLGRKTETFTFLGFTFYMGKTRKGSLRPMVKTSKEKLRRVVKGMSEYLRERRNVALEGWYPIFLSKLRGHLNYFGVSGNMRHLRKVLRHSRSRLFYWLNRRSQKKSFTQEAFEKFLVRHPLPEARIVHRLYSAPRPV
jgi:group II intron reverse transcriptase/maturase